ncbi:hypothetical protein BS50DRAFT_580442 [Corynespora cassiicola Philippines]|uniref:DUF676 domain-containing protein n=1 Tax=Corynespora cassiicola Philippines TaxID=1448308 RepID=A0A2T2N055_CORCC|nr:hypothetical protein BS50DRAFT_580442 [Corynespora cassiicola Philippines]
MDLASHADAMLNDIKRINKGSRPIIFIAHSFGGILLKKALVIAANGSREYQRVANKTNGILFLGVPHHGTKASFIASILSCTAYWRGSSTVLLETISEGNPDLLILDKDFRDIYVHPSSASGFGLPYIRNFIEMKPERYGRLSLGPTVSIDSAQGQYSNPIFLDTDHRGLNKFPSPNDGNFEKLLEELRKSLYHEKAVED